MDNKWNNMKGLEYWNFTIQWINGSGQWTLKTGNQCLKKDKADIMCTYI